MTAANYPACEKRVLDHEGSTYTDGVHPYDPGGPTRWGITLTDARLHWNPKATANDVRTMPVSVAMQIYKTKYWDVVKGDALPSGLDDTVFDYGVNSGVGRSGKVLRRLVNLPDNTSAINNEVLAAVAKRDEKAIIIAMNDERLRFLQSLSIWPTYKNGWTTRVNEVKTFSLQLADNQTPAPATPNVDTPKGQIPPPTAAKNIAKGGAAPTVPLAVWLWDWIVTHPVGAAMIAVGIGALISLAIYLIEQNHKDKQEAPTPGLVPVPEKA